MMRYLVQPRNEMFVKGYGFLFFAKSKSKSSGKNISKNLSGKYSQKILDHAKQSPTYCLKLLQKEQFKKQQKQLVV